MSAAEVGSSSFRLRWSSGHDESAVDEGGSEGDK